MKTPKVEKTPKEIVDKEKNSGKKLVQARLPFKILSTPTASELPSTKELGKDLTEGRKRKLSFDKNECATEQVAKKRPIKVSEPNANVDKKKKEIALVKKSLDVVVLSDSDDDNDCNKSYSKENVKAPIAATTIKSQKQLESDQEADLHSDDVEPEASSDEEPKKLETAKECAVKSTPTTNKKSDTKLKTRKGTQKATNNVKERKNSGTEANADSKVLIKLPISAKKNKRRKTATQTEAQVKELASNDEIDLTSPNQQQKRAKLAVDNEDGVGSKQLSVTEVKKSGENEKVQQAEVSEKKEQQRIETKTTEKEAEKSEKPKETISTKIKENEKIENAVEVMSKEETKNEEKENSDNKIQVDLEEVSPVQSTTVSIHESEEEITSGSDTNKSKIQELSSASTDAEADAETETTIKADALLHEKNTKGSNEASTTPKTLNESTSNKLQKKNLTPKQQKLLEQRLKAREEKERKIQEERLQKQREKEDRELAKKREREEKEELKRKEREEKEEQRRKEREEKERKRLEELEAKNEEKRKRNEAKEEELRKKEEDRKRKEQEKEEAELKKKKAALAFTKFFSRAATKNEDEQIKAQHEPENVVLAFRPFQVKGAMRLAPIVRKNLNSEARSILDTILEESKDFDQTELYVQQLKKGVISPQKWMAPVQKDDIEMKQSRESENDDVIIVEDELERAGQAIVEEPVAPVERLRVKFYRFHENRRPPYYGTWRKKSKVITARRPLAQDKQFFDYEVDSDDEWEEEEPGESLDGSDDDKEKESEDEDYEVDNDWFVPHGHLSEEEMQGEDDLGENNDREAQKAKLQILQKEFAQEMKKKTEKIKPRLIGCIWVDENGNQPELCPQIIWNTLNTRAILCAEPPVLEEIENKIDKDNESTGTNGQNSNEKSTGETKLKPIRLTEPMLKNLIKLVHGNTHSKNFIIQEFIAYIEANEESVRNGDVKGPLKSAVREKIDQFAQWQVIEKSEDEKNDTNVNSAKKKKNKKKLCWVVSAEALQKMNMETLNLINDWEYILKPHKSKATSTPTTSNTNKTKTETSSIALTSNGDDSNEHSETSVEQNGASPSNKNKTPNTTNIKKFAKVLTAVEKAQQLEKSKEIIKTPISKRAATTITTSSTPTTKSLTPSTKNSDIIKSNNNNNNNTTPTVKKRVPLLMSVARGQAISTPDKDARISKFLKSLNDAKQQKENNKTTINDATPPIPMEVDDVVVLDD